ncbi:S1 RNA-binding domain-containing protein [Psychroserpens sp.]|uniref:CvfB family protein n=1 Tax=Psychroserpens sp. TaxID=2020870 RepID=UPI001B286389|nr:S1-like domain-containing RNA-binding protein [Psychroserpens sp.]MBO6606625.1 GntR family transcriptional regulator [Psychroserpens sp.]MBO6653329.1 GntR family transcriptional regulator [Psychroserpens sp.]MBO6680644.1 GntR family transcriptional regulator [Psychroserpens sp.]MBO6750398.1 GntR family transcriptional regulator [Psychroserpens sp.]MBO6914880.1 GntR family transcriptional regulator [Psychroserpens sp.]
MINIGEYNTLEIIRDTEQGLYIADNEGNEVLLPNRYIPEAFNFGDEIKVFVYLDNEERLVAVTDDPYVTRDNFALLRCSQVTSHGAFLDWGMVKELFCPFKEQAFKMKAGGWYLVYCYLDEETERLVASSKTNRFLDNKELTVEKFDTVDLIVSHPSEIGMNVIVNKKHLGLIYKDDIYKELSVGDELKGIVKKVRSDNKLDISLGQIGYRNIEPNADIVMNHLMDSADGFLSLNDKSSPEAIKQELQMSKKTFKKAIGTLYKKRLITIEPEGIRLVK